MILIDVVEYGFAWFVVSNTGCSRVWAGLKVEGEATLGSKGSGILEYGTVGAVFERDAVSNTRTSTSQAMARLDCQWSINFLGPLGTRW